MVKNWQWLVRFYHLSWPIFHGLLLSTFFCCTHYISRYRQAKISRLKGGGGVNIKRWSGAWLCMVGWWSVCRFPLQIHSDPPPSTTAIVMCSWNLRGIWQRGRDPTHPANKLRRLALVKSNYEVRFFTATTGSCWPSHQWKYRPSIRSPAVHLVCCNPPRSWRSSGWAGRGGERYM